MPTSKARMVTVAVEMSVNFETDVFLEDGEGAEEATEYAVEEATSYWQGPGWPYIDSTYIVFDPEEDDLYPEEDPR